MPTGFKAEDLSGQRFGRLVVVCRTGSTKRGGPLQLCICDCGNEIKVTSGNLKGGNTKSCGCYRRENAKRNQPKATLAHAKPGSLLRQLYGHYKQGAERRKVLFSLSVEEFESLVQSDCYYCGDPPSRRYRPTRYKDVYLSNGIDRVNNQEGYVFENCVPCCRMCNQFKSDYTQQQMFTAVKKIYDKHVRPLP